MPISRQDVVCGTIALREHAAHLKIVMQQQLQVLFNEWQQGDALIYGLDAHEITELPLPLPQSLRDSLASHTASLVEIGGKVTVMRRQIEALAHSLGITSHSGAICITPENSRSEQEACWHDPTDWRIPSRPAPVASWYDTLPDDTACSLEEWNAKVDALLEDVAKFHQAIDTE